MTSVTFRHPGVLAISVAGVDQMSGGRVELGLGAGWYEAEHAAYGIPFPGTRERFERLEEALEVVTGLWDTPAGGATTSRAGTTGSRTRRRCPSPCSRRARRCWSAARAGGAPRPWRPGSPTSSTSRSSRSASRRSSSAGCGRLRRGRARPRVAGVLQRPRAVLRPRRGRGPPPGRRHRSRRTSSASTGWPGRQPRSSTGSVTTPTPGPAGLPAGARPPDLDHLGARGRRGDAAGAGALACRDRRAAIPEEQVAAVHTQREVRRPRRPLAHRHPPVATAADRGGHRGPGATTLRCSTNLAPATAAPSPSTTRPTTALFPPFQAAVIRETPDQHLGGRGGVAGSGRVGDHEAVPRRTGPQHRVARQSRRDRGPGAGGRTALQVVDRRLVDRDAGRRVREDWRPRPLATRHGREAHSTGAGPCSCGSPFGAATTAIATGSATTCCPSPWVRRPTVVPVPADPAGQVATGAGDVGREGARTDADHRWPSVGLPDTVALEGDPAALGGDVRRGHRGGRGGGPDQIAGPSRRPPYAWRRHRPGPGRSPGRSRSMRNAPSRYRGRRAGQGAGRRRGAPRVGGSPSSPVAVR